MPLLEMVDGMKCPADREEIAEQYVLGRLTPAELATFDAHLVRCSRCAEALIEAFEFMEAFQGSHTQEAPIPLKRIPRLPAFLEIAAKSH